MRRPWREGTTDSFEYTIRDGFGREASAAVTMTITQHSGVSVAGGILRMSGEPGSDVITVSGGNPIVNGVSHSLAGVTEVRIWTRAGDDRVDLSGLAIRALIHGGQGNDELAGGADDDVIFGGAGNDSLTGAAGHDFLIGGDGQDRIVGSAGNDVLVADDVACNLSLAALREISDGWASSRSIQEEGVDDFLEEIVGDDDYDVLTGSSGADLFIIDSGDKITDFGFGKPKTNKDGDVVIRDGLTVS